MTSPPPPSQTIDHAFTDPYRDTDLETCRKTFNISLEDWSFIKQLDPFHSSRQTMIAILIHRTVNELKKHGITNFDPQAFRAAVGGLTITLGNVGATNADDSNRTGSSTTSRSSPAVETAVANDGHRTGQLPQLPSTNTVVAPKIRRTSKRAGVVSGGSDSKNPVS